jgi:hypothetical protein
VLSIYFLSSILFAVAAAIIARMRGRTMSGWFLAGLFIGPFSLIVALLPPIPHQGRLAQCPGCAEAVSTEAAICHFCGSRL